MRDRVVRIDAGAASASSRRPIVIPSVPETWSRQPQDSSCPVTCLQPCLVLLFDRVLFSNGVESAVIAVSIIDAVQIVLIPHFVRADAGIAWVKVHEASLGI